MKQTLLRPRSGFDAQYKRPTFRLALFYGCCYEVAQLEPLLSCWVLI